MIMGKYQIGLQGASKVQYEGKTYRIAEFDPDARKEGMRDVMIEGNGRPFWVFSGELEPVCPECDGKGKIIHNGGHDDEYEETCICQVHEPESNPEETGADDR